MKTVKHFFRKYFLSTILILLLFLLVNAVLVAGLFYVADSRASSPDLSIEKLADMVSVENGKIQVSEEMAPLLHTKNAWAMLLNENGMVLWEENLPAGLPHSYDATQIAKFSKWYLGDFPVLVWEHPAGLFVVGYPPDSVVKYNFVLDRNYVSISLIGTALVFVVNILLMLLLFWHNTHRVEKAVGPILTGIETMAGGKEIQLAEQGELAEINAGLNKAASQLAKKDSARAEWINGISHDIRTPLSIMLGYAGEIEDDNKLPTDTRAQAEIICKQGERLRKLVADLNLASKLEYSMQPMNRTLISPVELTRQVMSDFLNNGIDTVFDMDFEAYVGTEKIVIEGDSILLTRALENLIHNSMIHNPAGCNIKIIIFEYEGSCTISVADTGSGIAASLLERLNSKDVQPFTWDASGEPTHGLGLNLVQRIVKAHSGKITFENVEPHGLKAILELPIKDKI